MSNVRQPDWFESYFGSDYMLIDIQPNTDIETVFMRQVLGLVDGRLLLDVGCGYGRHIVPLAKTGVRVVGCDLSAFMLTEAQRRISQHDVSAAGLVRCDSRELPFRESFDAACCMFNTFGYFDREDDNYRMLAEIAVALKPGAPFLLDLVNRDLVIRDMPCNDWHERDETIILERKWFDPVRSRSEIDVRVVDKQGKRAYHHSIRLYSYMEVAMLLEAAGMTVEAVYGGFEGEPYDVRHDRMLILARAMER
jgi:SAM-dependent methyltransferase